MYSDLIKVGQLEALNHAPTTKTFLSKLPSKASGQRYIALATEMRARVTCGRWQVIVSK